MKKILTLTLVLLFSNIVFSQTTLSNKEIVYMTGSYKMPGYTSTTKTLNITTYTFTSLSVRAPILQVYVCDKNKFIGGILEDDKGNKTTILNLKITETTKTVNFEVVGKEFSRSFMLYEGEILQEEKNFTTFYTDNVGIWKIYKKGFKK